MPEPFSFALCADDYAMTPGVSRGILEALDACALSATSVMTTSPSWPDDAAPLRPYIGRADLGLHLNLTLGRPLGTMAAFAPDGRFPGIGPLMRLARSGRLPLDEIAEEIGRQCDRFVAVLGRPPDHVDGHQHVQALRAIRPLVFAALAQRGWRPWLRDSADRLSRLMTRAGRRKAVALSLLGDGFARDASIHSFDCNDGFAGYSSFDPLEDYAKMFASYLKAPGRRHLVMCHPGHVDDALRRLDPVVETRETELRFLTTELHDMLAHRGATLTRLSGFRS